MNYDVKEWHKLSLAKIDSLMDSLLTIKTPCETLVESMRYSSLNGGKRIRPLLTLSASVLSHANVEDALLIGSTIELIHCFSLIHDDLPIMDNDSMRRGKPTNHIIYGDAVALLTGDALHAICFEILSSNKISVTAEKKIKIINLIANAIGVHGMVCGQTIDWLNTGKKIPLHELQQMHTLKTGALIRASILSGYLAGDGFHDSQYQRMDDISQKIGLLFQVVDDIIDATEDSHTLGKTANKDAEQNKSTYVTLLGLEEAKKSALNLHKNIIEIIKLENNSEYLQYLTDQIYYRNS
ncbi:MAG: polyprenyl synthetase family protein [Burkholderiales bacterium]|nr:polyprenyl synthetase family protein [Burkholderiales bacterium]